MRDVFEGGSHYRRYPPAAAYDRAEALGGASPAGTAVGTGNNGFASGRVAEATFRAICSPQSTSARSLAFGHRQADACGLQKHKFNGAIRRRIERIRIAMLPSYVATHNRDLYSVLPNHFRSGTSGFPLTKISYTSDALRFC